jgi:hypothetical protein
MQTVTRTRLVIVVGRRTRARAERLLRAVEPGAEVGVFVLGLRPTPAQLRFTEDALSLADTRRLSLTAELVPNATTLGVLLEDDDRVVVAAGGWEARRLRLVAGGGAVSVVDG